MIISDRQGLCNRNRVSKLQEGLIQALQDQITENHPNEVGLFPRLLMIISNLREISVEHRRLLGSMRTQIEQGKVEFEEELFGVIE